MEEAYYYCYNENPFRLTCVGEFKSFMEADNAFLTKIEPLKINKGSSLLSTYKIFPDFVKHAHLRYQYLSYIKTIFRNDKS